jgi:endonuclease/exonuclease/phosphatase family metal-dependent hydrolase
VGRDDGKAQGEFAAILYRTDRCDLVDQGTFWFSDTPGIAGSKHWGNDVTRICTWARLRMRANSRCIYVFNVHLDHISQVSRERSTRLLRERIAQREHLEDPAIVTGDFNIGASNEALRTLLSPASDGSPAPLIDTWRTMHPSDDEIGTYHAFKGGSSGEKIDFILVEPGTRVRAADVLQDAEGGRYPSDHYPVTAGCTMYWNR